MQKKRFDLKYNSIQETYSMYMDNPPKNVFTINTIETEKDTLFSKGSWIFILFAGYSGPDIIMVSRLLDVVTEFPEINFALKGYMRDEKMQEFTEVDVYRKVTPVLLYRSNRETTFLASRVIEVEKAAEIVQKIQKSLDSDSQA